MCCVAEAKHCDKFTRRATAGCSEVEWVVAKTYNDSYVVWTARITLALVAERVCRKRFYAPSVFAATHVATAALFS